MSDIRLDRLGGGDVAASGAGGRIPNERAALALADRGVRAMAVRSAPTVHGAGDHGFVSLLVAADRRHGAAAYVGDGANRWPAVHRSDAARLVSVAVEKAPAGSVLHVVGEEGVALRDVAGATDRFPRRLPRPRHTRVQRPHARAAVLGTRRAHPDQRSRRRAPLHRRRRVRSSPVTARLTVAVAAPVPDGTVERLVALEPRLDLRYEPALLPPMRHPADFQGDPGFRRSGTDQDRFEDLLDRAEALYGIPDVDPAALRRTVRANPGLRWVHTMAAGGGSQVRAADLTPDELSRIAFTTSAGVHALPLAEFALFGLLAGAKTLPRLRQQQDELRWSGRWTMGQLAEQTVLVAGLGGIGGRVVELLAALGTRVVGLSRHAVERPGLDRVVRPDELTAVAGEIDALVTTLPGTDATTGLFGGDFFAALRPGATVVNVGRGTVIDEAALVAALRSGRVGFAALDVFAVEPLPADSPLWTMPNVLVSPHTAALSVHEDGRIAELFARNATRLLDGDELLNRVDLREFY